MKYKRCVTLRTPCNQMKTLAQQHRDAVERCRLEMFGRREQRGEIFAKQRQELFGDVTRDALFQAPDIALPHLIFIAVPKEVWSDEALKAKVEAGWSLDELTSFLHAQIHPQFAEVVQSHSEVDYSAEKDKMWVGTRPEKAGNQPETKQKEHFAGGQ